MTSPLEATKKQPRLPDGTLTALRRPLAHAAWLSLAVNLLMLAPALFMLQVFDRVLSSRSAETLLVLGIGLAIALGLMLVLDVLRSRLQGVAGSMLADELAPTVARLMMAQGAARHGGVASEGLRDVATLRSLFTSQGLIALFDAPWIPIYVAVIALAHPWLGAAALASSAFMLALALAADRLTRTRMDATVRAASLATRQLEASLANAEVAQVMGMSNALLDRWQRRSVELHALQSPMARRSVAMAAITRASRHVIQACMLALGAWFVIRGEATAGVMIAASTLLGRALAPVEQLVGSWRVLAEARVAWRRLKPLLQSAEAAAATAPMALPAPLGALTVQQLVYRAPHGERLLLAGVSFALAPGESLAIVGASGAGKSTLVRLLSGVWVPSAGHVRLDGADLAQWPRDALGPHVGYVPQDVQLFAGTVAENIARMTASLDNAVAADVVAAAQAAHCHEMILALPQGYDTVFEPGSALLSPGQQQRIALARALYGQPTLVLLDEPNANLDGTGEQALAVALAGLRGRATVVVVTHRTTLTSQVDKMLVLDGGRVQQFGATVDVMKAMQAAAQAMQAQAVHAMPARQSTQTVPSVHAPPMAPPKPPAEAGEATTANVTKPIGAAPAPQTSTAPQGTMA